MQHFLAAGLLLLATFSRFQNSDIELMGFDGIYIAVNLITAIANILIVVVGKRIQSKETRSNLVRGVFALTGVALLADSVDSIRAGTKYLHFVKLFAAFLYVMLAVFYKRLRKIRRIELTDQKLLISLTALSRHVYMWQDIEKIAVKNDHLLIKQISGKSLKISIGEMAEQQIFFSSLEKHLKRWNIPLAKQ
ncbi:MAG: hypothetical protein AAFP70_05640 [Calditrichota bacterium]